MPLSQTLKKNSRILWTVSMIYDQNPHTQTKAELAEMANDVMNTSSIDSVTVCLADNLQRFRLMIQHGISEQEATEECQRLSTVWYEDNKATLDNLSQSKKLSLLTWQQFLEWPDYQKTLDEVEALYKNNRDFRHDVDGRIRQAREAISPDAKIDDPVEQIALLKRYLFEECAYQKFAASKGFNYELYKTPMSKAMRQMKRNSDFVPSGILTEIYFTQFNPAAKKQPKESFKPLFSNGNQKPAAIAEVPSLEGEKLPHQKISEFFEKVFELMPPAHQQKAVDALLKFATTDIIPLCYVHYANSLSV